MSGLYAPQMVVNSRMLYFTWVPEDKDAVRALVPAELKAVDPGSPDNVRVQAKIDADWYEKNYARTRQEFLDMIAS